MAARVVAVEKGGEKKAVKAKAGDVGLCWSLGALCRSKGGCWAATWRLGLLLLYQTPPLTMVALGLADWDLCPAQPALPLFTVALGTAVFALHLLCVLYWVWLADRHRWHRLGRWELRAAVACPQVVVMGLQWTAFAGLAFGGPKAAEWTAVVRGMPLWLPRPLEPFELGCSERLAKVHLAVSWCGCIVPAALLGLLLAGLLLFFVGYVLGHVLCWMNGWERARPARSLRHEWEARAQPPEPRQTSPLPPPTPLDEVSAEVGDGVRLVGDGDRLTVRRSASGRPYTVTIQPIDFPHLPSTTHIV